MKTVILIGGAPATGKTTISKELSARLNIPYFSTDFLRDWMVDLVNEKDYPALFVFGDLSAAEHHKKYSTQEHMQMEELRDADTWLGVTSYIKNSTQDSVIIEGISVHPKYIHELDIKDCKVVSLFLVDQSEKRIKDILATRGLWGKTDDVKAIEAKNIKEANKYYLKEAQKYDYPYFLIEADRQKTIDEVVAYVSGEVRK